MSNEERPKKARKTKEPLDFDQARAAILQALQKGGAKGAATLAGKAVLTANQAMFDDALAALEREGAAIVNREAAKPKYYFKEFAPSHREAILKKLLKAGAKGSSALVTSSASANTRAAIERDAAALESEGVIVVDRNGAKPKYYLKEFAPALPNLEQVCARLEEFATAKFPQIFAEAELKKELDHAEAALLGRAIYWLENQRELVRLRRGAAVFFVSGRALRGAVAEGSAEIPEAISSPVRAVVPEPVAVPEDIAGRIREAYRVKVEQSGFPSVKIAALLRDSSAPLPVLHRWLMEEHQQGRAVLSFGDWSLSDDETRSAALELRGERYLLVRLLR